ncbi:MAG: hypothetical protein R2834_24505 [Rhodothermales bacterium]
MKNIHGLLLVGCSAVALAGCGADDIASPGTGGNVTINNTTNNPAPTPTPTPTPTGGAITPASGCPTIADPQGLTDDGTITGPTGTYRVCSLPNKINESIKLTKISGLLYQLKGRVDVGDDGGFTGGSDTNVTLSIDPGVIVFGGTGVSWLAVNRGNKINAVGTQTQPIIFTSRDNVLGLNTENSSAQWGGVVLMGRGKVTDCNYGSVAAGTCERDTEGAADPAIFGGADDTYNAGTIDYVQVRFSGYVIGADKELQSLTPEAVGSGTSISHFMTYNSSDDGIEFFGGVTNLKYYVAVGAEDDNLDVDTGARVNAQYVIVAQRQDVGDTMMEIDSNGLESDTPRTNIKVANFTYIQRKSGNSDGTSMFFRGNSDVTLMNGILISPNNPCLGIHNSFTTAAFESVLMQCGSPKYINTGSAAADAGESFFGAGDNNDDSFSPTLTSLFINGSNESGVTAFDPSTVDSFFDATDYVGAVKDAADTWYGGWTCNSTAADFGVGNSGLCTSLPTS